jgi:hypothetical protein
MKKMMLVGVMLIAAIGNHYADPFNPAAEYVGERQKSSHLRYYLLDDKPVPVEDPISAADLQEIHKMLIHTGVSADPSSLDNDRQKLEAAYREALNRDQTHPLITGQPKEELEQLWKIMNLATRCQVLDQQIPENLRALNSIKAHTAGTLRSFVPKELLDTVKEATGGKLSFDDLNLPLQNLESTHDELLSAVNNIIESPQHKGNVGMKLLNDIGDVHDPAYGRKLNYWIHNSLTPQVGAFVDTMQANNTRMPDDFVNQAGVMQFGNNAPGWSEKLPIQVHNLNDVKDKVHTDQYFQDETGTTWQKTDRGYIKIPPPRATPVR